MSIKKPSAVESIYVTTTDITPVKKPSAVNSAYVTTANTTDITPVTKPSAVNSPQVITDTNPVTKPSTVDSPYVTTDTTPTKLAAAPVAGGGISTVVAAVANTVSADANTDTSTSSTGSNVSYYASGIEGIAGLANYGRVFDGANVYVTLEQQQYNTYNQTIEIGNSISVTGNITTSSGYFIGNGSQLTGIAVSYGNANVVANLAALGSNPVSTTGNVTAGYFVGNGSQLTGLAATYGNANVVANLAALGSNPVSTTGNITGNNIIGAAANIPSVVSQNLDVENISARGSAGVNIGAGGFNNLVVEQTQVLIQNVPLSVSGNVIGGNIRTGGVISATGNITGSNINSPTLNNSGNISVVASGNTWTFGSTGNLTVPATNSVPARISTQTTLASEKGFDLRITAGNTNGCTVPGGDMYLSAGVGYNGISHGAGNVNIVTGDRYGNVTGNIWRFDSSGALTLPLGSATIKNTVGNAVAFGLNAGLTSQGNSAVAIGIDSGVYSQSTNAVAIGTLAGNGGRVTTNYVSGAVSPSTTLVVTSTTGIVPGMVITGTGFFGTITVVTVTNSTTLEISASAVFTPSGALNFTGSQGDNSVAIGTQAGQVQQGQFAVAIGDNAGNKAQGTDAVAIGASAGLNTQGAGAVAFGQGTGETSQGANAVALGKAAGQVNQGINSIAIGRSAGVADQGNNSIILNATGAVLDQTTANTFTVAPIRNDVANVAQVMFYNTTSKEITYGNVISVAGNITGGNLLTAGLISAIGNVSGNFFIGNGSQLTGIAASYGNTNVAAFLAAYGSNTVSTTGNITTGNLLTGGLISATSTITGTSHLGSVVSVTGNVTGGNILTAGVVTATGNIVTAGNFVGNGAALTNVTVSVAGNIVGTQSNVTLVAGAYSTVFDNTGNTAFANGSVSLTTLSASGNITGGNISATNHTGTTVSVTGNITAANFFGNGNTLSNVATRFESAWTVPVGNSTQSFTVPINNTYQLWVLCNIPNGIISYQATVSVTNTNVPVLGTQRAWNYTGGGSPILLTTMPTQIVGAEGTISTAVPLTLTGNQFDFVINNTSGSAQTVRYGWVAIS